MVPGNRERNCQWAVCRITFGANASRYFFISNQIKTILYIRNALDELIKDQKELFKTEMK